MDPEVNERIILNNSELSQVDFCDDGNEYLAI